jgi:hypothetical protein
MIRGLLTFISLNQPLAGYIPSLQVSYESVDAPLSENIAVDGGLLTPVTVTVADVTQIWAYSVSHAWLSVVGASLLGTDTCRIMIEPQPTGAQPPRTGYVTFTSDDCANKVITIIQAARAG